MTARLTANRIWQLAYGLSERDLAVAASLAKLRVASVRQLQRLHYPTQARSARRALKQLAERRIIARLHRSVGGARAGSAGWIYALDIVGQSLVGNGGPAGGVRLRRPWTPGVRFLDHALAVSEVYAGLVELSRAGRFELAAFEAEPECWRSYEPIGGPAVLKPDAYARLGFAGYEDSYFIEVDRGTESPRTLELKAEAYLAYYNSGEEQHQRGVFPRVLWLVPDQPRAQVVRDAVSGNQQGANLHLVATMEQLDASLTAAP